MKGQFLFSIAIVTAIASVLGMLATSFFGLPGMQQTATAAEVTPTYVPTTRTFYLFNAELEQVNEAGLGFSGDIYSVQTMVVNKGDTVNIRFFNTEPTEEDERHSFTLPTFNKSVELDPGKQATISFLADKTGIFEYKCKFHQPEMRGQLIVNG
jgi:heme/copper-type cytochrome/quinol oxidase subunit 2